MSARGCLLAGLLGTLWALPPAALAGGDAEAGREKSTPCQACHGLDGRGIDPSYPHLAGQYASYLEKALRDYRDGTRQSPLMSGFAANLSDADIADLAAWYAAQEKLTVVEPGD